MMVQRRHLQEIHDSAGGSATFVFATKNQAPDAHMDERARAHRAGLLGDVQVAIAQAPVAHGRLRLRDRQHLGVRGGVLQQLDLIMRARDDSSFTHHHRTDRHFLGLERFFCLAQRFAHKENIQVFDHSSETTPRDALLLARAMRFANTTARSRDSRTHYMNMRLLLVPLVLASSICLATAATEQEVVNRSAAIMRGFRSIPESDIPRSVMRNARGLAIMTVVKAGFVFSGKGGQGVVVARTGNGWSGPSFIGTGGAGWGLQVWRAGD